MDTIYQDIAVRTGGNVYIGVVGPVRTGKSTLIKALRKFGLKRICKEAQHVEHSGYKLVGTIPFRDDKGNIDKSKQDL